MKIRKREILSSHHFCDSDICLTATPQTALTAIPFQSSRVCTAARRGVYNVVVKKVHVRYLIS